MIAIAKFACRATELWRIHIVTSYRPAINSLSDHLRTTGKLFATLCNHRLIASNKADVLGMTNSLSNLSGSIRAYSTDLRSFSFRACSKYVSIAHKAVI